jgi:hypothetical protein
MNAQLTDRILLATAAGGVLLTGLAFAIWGGQGALAAAVGATVATANWAATRFLGKASIGKGKNPLLALMGFKTMALALVCWLCITRFHLHFLGFTVGISALVLGVLLGPMLTPSSSEPSPTSADLPAEET